MKTQLNEVKQLQKLAGLLKENDNYQEDSLKEDLDKDIINNITNVIQSLPLKVKQFYNSGKADEALKVFRGKEVSADVIANAVIAEYFKQYIATNQ
jgi:hypothetical protein